VRVVRSGEWVGVWPQTGRRWSRSNVKERGRRERTKENALEGEKYGGGTTSRKKTQRPLSVVFVRP
jgi:hypothetical protein